MNEDDQVENRGSASVILRSFVGRAIAEYRLGEDELTGCREGIVAVAPSPSTASHTADC